MGILSSEPGLPLWSDYTRFARRHIALIGALMFIGAAIGVGWAMQQPTTYSATASIALTPVPKYVTPSTSELVPPEVTIDTDAQLLQSPKVLEAVAAALGTTPDEALQRLSVSATPTSNVLHVTVRSSSAKGAAAAANAAVTELIGVRRDSLGALQQNQLSMLQLLVSTEERNLSKTQTSRVTIPATDDLFAQLQQLRAEIDELEAARREPAVVLQAAVPPPKAEYSNSEVPVVSGAMLGFLLACGVGAMRDRARQPQVRTALSRRLSQLSGQVPATATLREDTNNAT
jgi:hypothetical protein